MGVTLVAKRGERHDGLGAVNATEKKFVIEIGRHLHLNPELSEDEERTIRFIARR